MYKSIYKKIVDLVTAPIQPNYFLAALAGSVVSGLFGSSGAKKAASAKRKGARRAAALAKQQYEESKKAFKPYTDAGTEGLKQYQNLLGDQAQYENIIQSNVQDPFSFTAEDFNRYKDPGYDFRLSEGKRMLDTGFAAGGKFNSGERARGLMELGQNLGSAEFGAARNRAFQDYTSSVQREQDTYRRSLGQYGRQYVDVMGGYGSLADAGRSAVGTIATLGAASAQNQGGYAVQAANAKSAGILGQYGAYSKAIGGIGNAFRGLGGFSGGSSAGSDLSANAAPASLYNWGN